MPFLWLRTWRLGVKSLLLHPLRSLLTVLGIFIGVASVVWLLAIGEGISRKTQEQIEGLGATNIIIRSIKPSEESIENVGSSRSIVPYGITRADFDRLITTVPTIDRALPIREVRYRFGYLGRNIEGRLVGCTPEYAEVNQLEVDRGRFLSDTDDHKKWNHCVLAAGTAEKLFPFENPIGRAIRIEQAFYLVVGVMKERTPTAGIGGSLTAQEFNNDVYIPIRTLWSRIGDIIVTRRTGSFEGEMIELSQVTLRVDKVENVLKTAALVKETLKLHHRKQDYAVTVPLELLKQAKTTRLMFIVFMGLIAAISLVVGGIGIMNIMLATVTERTREIGIRRALGAKRGDITRQFLVETVTLSVVGGATGVLGGLTCRPLIGALRGAMQRAAPDVFEQLPEVIREVTPIVVPWSIPLAFGISVTIGVIFGLYPAIRAAAMDPIEALRHE
ncbi:MAG: ABC transporter permease [Planctomycetes bacterium]|nr:ABC transporter permease [Planctomycetota bacterium]MCG2685158.1 ABC transporter permease [Planctomycetales bacterium]